MSWSRQSFLPQSIVDNRSVKAAKRYTNSEAVSDAKKRVNKWKAKHATSASLAPRRASGFLKFCRKNACEYKDVPEALERCDSICSLFKANAIKITHFRSTGRTKRTAALVNDWQKLSQPEKDAWEKKAAARSVDLYNYSLISFHKILP